MASKLEIKQEAMRRQGNFLDRRERFYVPGGASTPEFQIGGEGLVHRVVDAATRRTYRAKCFWNPDAKRRQRSEVLAREQLADLAKASADALAGAPFAVIDQIRNSPNTPFAVLMKDVPGTSWKDLCDNARGAEKYPAVDWPDLRVRATWAYGLATAVREMERRQFIHADLSPGNVMVTHAGPTAGDMALVDFDGFVHPKYPHLDTSIEGSDGYAAPEVRSRRGVGEGTDRLGMAILIQEFLIIGDPELSRDEAFGFVYEQAEHLEERRGVPHPLVDRKCPEIGQLIRETLRAEHPQRRPQPDIWRPMLRALVNGEMTRWSSKILHHRLVPTDEDVLAARYDLVDGPLDLFASYGIRGSIEQASSGPPVLRAGGAELRFKRPPGSRWETLPPQEVLILGRDTVIFDSVGRDAVRVIAQTLVTP